MPLDLHREIGGGARIRAGIEFDATGRRIAYHVLSSRPSDPLRSYRTDAIRVPSTDCLHLFKPLAAGQLRGITWLVPVLLRLHELDQFEDAALVKAKVAALFTGFITDPDGTAGGLSGPTRAVRGPRVRCATCWAPSAAPPWTAGAAPR